MRQYHLLGLAVVGGVMLMAPRLVGAHSAVGPCADCHTMHNSQNGSPENLAGPQPHLLKMTCVGCHARTTNESNGRATSAGGPAAPQVGPQVAGQIYQLSGGYFNVDGGLADATTHNLADLGGSVDSQMSGSTAPGGSSFAIENSSAPGKPLLQCVSCHDSTIGHAQADLARTGTSTSSYRMLGRGGQYVVGQGDIDFEAGSGQNKYDADSMNKFCATCHGLFHSATGSSGAWVRHPTDVSTTVYAPANYTGTDKVVPVGDAGSGKTNMVMCLSCHRPHGNANLDMIRFTYNGSANLANDGTTSQGCETCHGPK